MKFHEKLDFLMKLTNCNNSQLGRAISFDPSYISRIRSGKRGMPKKQPFLEPAAAFFARNLTEEYQKRAAAEAVCGGRPWPETGGEALISSWLSEKEETEGPVREILREVSEPPAPPAAVPPLPVCPPGKTVSETGFFYGNEGKRQAVEQFLTELCSLNRPQTLLLSSNEEFDWLFEDSAFARRWAGLMMRLAAGGSKVIIIHSVSRGAGEMLMAFQKWNPLYMTGFIEPYYYPKLRDRVYRRTIFVARGYSAIASSSVGTHTEGALNLLFHDRKAVDALEQEFLQYFALCRPLMQIFDARSREHFLALLQEFNEDEEELLMALPVPSFAMMNREAAEAMAGRCGGWLLRNCADAVRHFERQLALGHTVTEILHLPDPRTVREGRLEFPMWDLFGTEGVYYRTEEFAAHLQEVVSRLRTCRNYRVVLSREIPQNEIIYVKENLGAVVVRAASPSVVFGISEQRLTSAVWDYLARIADSGSGRKKVISELERYIRNLLNPRQNEK